ncbi:MAG: NAD(P)H-hydrate dehydratase [Syntrophaceae bacterium]
MKIASVIEMRTMDREAVEQFGISEQLLMENAGMAACTVISREFGVRGKRFIIFCGMGNNGGDGFVAARKLHSMGGRVKVFILGDPKKYSGAAKVNYKMASLLAMEMKSINSADGLREAIDGCDAIVDAIFGTGLTREIEGYIGRVIDLINSSGKAVFSLDIPSGINGDTGEAMGKAVRADFTVTFGLPKTGNILYPGFANCGNLSLSHISFPPSLYGNSELKVEINVPVAIPERKPDGYKKTFGEVLFIAGAAGYIGAPYFSSYSFLKAGGGYSRLAAPASVAPLIAAKGSEIVLHPQKETGKGSLAYSNKNELLSLANRMDLVVIGPGLSLDEEAQRLARELIAEIAVPVLIDGDGITAVSAKTELLRGRKDRTIITPHMGEMARLAGLSVAEIGKKQVEVLQCTARQLNAVIVLKGAHSLIGYPDGSVFMNMSGNAGMAKAGTGDVLNGIIAAMHGLGLPVPEAARMGVFVHGLAGDVAAQETGEDGISAQDLLSSLPEAVTIAREMEYGDFVEAYGIEEI